MKLVFSWATTEGRRISNEDAWCARPQLGLFAVADGMGGYHGGEIASRLAIESLVAFWSGSSAGGESDVSDGVERGARAAIEEADASIRARRRGELAKMGSTIALVLVRGERIVVAHVGDSRVYRLRGSKLMRLTRDHSLYEEIRRSGTAVPPRDTFPYGHVITRALGLDGPYAEAELRSEKLLVGDTVLLCTDGLTDALCDDRIGVLLSGEDVEDMCAELVAAAYDGGSKDNITVVMVRRVD